VRLKLKNELFYDYPKRTLKSVFCVKTTKFPQKFIQFDETSAKTLKECFAKQGCANLTPGKKKKKKLKKIQN